MLFLVLNNLGILFIKGYLRMCTKEEAKIGRELLKIHKKRVIKIDSRKRGNLEEKRRHLYL